MSTIYDWSLNPENNAMADDDINWQEGQLPSTINDSARMMMTRIRSFISEIGAQVEACYDSKNNIIIETAMGGSLDAGRIIRFFVPEDNKKGTKIMVDNTMFVPVFKSSYGEFCPIEEKDIQKNTIYEIILVKLFFGDYRWVLINPIPNIPVGMITLFPGKKAPPGWLLCDGEHISGMDYPALYKLLVKSTQGGVASQYIPLPRLSARTFGENFCYAIKV